MGSGGLQWDTADRLAKDRLNEKTIFRGTGAEIAAAPSTVKFALCTSSGSNFVADNFYFRDASGNWKPVSPFRGTGADIAALVTNSMTYAGMIALCTTSDSGFTAGFFYRRKNDNSGWDHFIATRGVVFPGSLGSDYVSPQNTGSVASSTAVSDTSTVFDSGGTASAGNRMDDTGDMVGEIVTSTSLRNKRLKSATFNCGTIGSPSGAIVAKLIRVSDGAELATSTNSIDASTIGTTGDQTWNFPDNAITPNENFRVVLYFANGTSTKYVYVRYAGSNSNSAGYRTRRAKSGGAWTDFTSDDSRMSIVTTDVALYFAVDGSTSLTSRWKSNSEANPYIYIDIGSEKLVSGCRIFWLTNGRPTTYNIDVSRDALSWTNVKAETTQPPAGAYKEYAWNTVIARYIRVQAQETIAMEISEIQYYSKTTDQVIADHGHGGIA